MAHKMASRPKGPAVSIWQACDLPARENYLNMWKSVRSYKQESIWMFLDLMTTSSFVVKMATNKPCEEM